MSSTKNSMHIPRIGVNGTTTNAVYSISDRVEDVKKDLNEVKSDIDKRTEEIYKSMDNLGEDISTISDSLDKFKEETNQYFESINQRIDKFVLYSNIIDIAFGVFLIGLLGVILFT